MKKYDIFYAGVEKITSVYSTCISKACKSFIGALEKTAKYKLDSKVMASITYSDNHTIFSDFVVMEV